MPPTWKIPTEEKSDGLGNPLQAAALYYVQDVRSIVGNCGSWWAPNGAGYVCNLNEAGLYTGEHCATMRGTDIPWPAEYVKERVVAHVRVDVQTFDTRNYKGGPRLILKDVDGDRYSFENIRTQGWLDRHTSGLDAAVAWLKERAVTLFRHGKDAEATNLRKLADDMDRALRTVMEANAKLHSREHPARLDEKDTE